MGKENVFQVLRYTHEKQDYVPTKTDRHDPKCRPKASKTLEKNTNNFPDRGALQSRDARGELRLLLRPGVALQLVPREPERGMNSVAFIVLEGGAIVFSAAVEQR